MKRATWTLILAGLLTGGLGLQLVVTQPLHRQIDRLTSEVNGLQSGLRLLADFRDEVAGTNDLLSGLQDQGRHLTQAQAALEHVRRLEREVKRHSSLAADALASTTDLARLQTAVIDQSPRIEAMSDTLDQLAAYQRRAEDVATSAADQLPRMDRADESLKRLASFHERIVAESAGIDVAETQFARLIGLKKSVEQIEQTDIDVARTRLDDLDSLRQDLLDGGQQTAAARQIGDHLLALQDDLVAQRTKADIARKHAAQLLNLEETLASDAQGGIDAAVQNLATLLEMEERLAAQDQQLARAVESLEVMEDLQEEFYYRTQDLESIRRGLMELVMMEGLVARTVRAFQPLTELADLRRLDASQIRSIAQSLLDRRTPRVATDDPELAVPSRSDVISADEELVPLPRDLK